MTFQHYFTYIISSTGFSLNITIMINILQEIKILHDKILKAINLYWFHNDPSEKNNLLNDRSNDRPTSCQIKSPWWNILERLQNLWSSFSKLDRTMLYPTCLWFEVLCWRNFCSMPRIFCWRRTGIMINIICDALRHSVSFVQFTKREKHPWRSVNFSKVARL